MAKVCISIIIPVVKMSVLYLTILSLVLTTGNVRETCNDYAAITEQTQGKLGICIGLDGALLSDPTTTDDELIRHTRGFVDETVKYKNYVVAGYANNDRVANLVLPELVGYSIEKYKET